MLRFLVLSLVAAAGAGCAPTPAGSPGTLADQRCFLPGETDNFRIASSAQIYVHARRGGVFRLDAAPGCFDASVRAVVVEPLVSAREQVCSGGRVRVRVVENTVAPRTCNATVAGPIDPAESRLPG